MTLSTPALGALALAGTALSLTLLALVLMILPESPLRRAARWYVQDLDRRHALLRLPQKGASLLAVQLVAALGLVALSVLTSLALLALIPIVVAAPNVLVRREYQRRIARIEQQLDGFMLALANALRAVPSLGEALAASQQLVHAPLSQELDLALKEYRLGASLDGALESLAERVDSRVVRSALSILRVARNSGGDLPSTLERAAASLREMARLEGVVRTKTADGRNQAFVLGALPVVIAVMLQTLQPGVLAPLFESDAGHLILLVAFGLWLGAIVLAVRVLKVDL